MRKVAIMPWPRGNVCFGLFRIHAGILPTISFRLVRSDSSPRLTKGEPLSEICSGFPAIPLPATFAGSSFRACQDKVVVHDLAAVNAVAGFDKFLFGRRGMHQAKKTHRHRNFWQAPGPCPYPPETQARSMPVSFLKYGWRYSSRPVSWVLAVVVAIINLLGRIGGKGHERAQKQGQGDSFQYHEITPFVKLGE